MENLCRFKSYSPYTWPTNRLYKVLLFPLRMGSRARDKHYKVKTWPKRKTLIPGAKNVSNEPLVDPNDIVIPPFHVKLGLMKNYVKAMDQRGNGFLHLKEKFTYISNAKLKEGIFVGPEIRKMKDEEFQKKLTAKERAVWISFKEVNANFLGNRRAKNYETLVAKILKNYERMDCNMSLKIHFLDSHFDFLKEKVIVLFIFYVSFLRQQLLLTTSNSLYF